MDRAEEIPHIMPSQKREKCPMCPQVYRLDRLKVHIKSKHPKIFPSRVQEVECTECKRYFKRNVFSTHMNSKHGVPFPSKRSSTVPRTVSTRAVVVTETAPVELLSSEHPVCKPCKIELRRCDLPNGFGISFLK